jgi:hypothetical protein
MCQGGDFTRGNGTGGESVRAPRSFCLASQLSHVVLTLKIPFLLFLDGLSRFTARNLPMKTVSAVTLTPWNLGFAEEVLLTAVF